MKQKAILIGIISLITLIGGISFIWWESQFDKKETNQQVKGVRESTFASEIILEIFNEPVTVVSNGNTIEAMEAKNGMVLKQGDTIETSNNGRAQIVFPNGTVTRLDKNTKVTLRKAELSPQQVEIVVNEGQIWSRIAELLQSETYVTLSEKVSASVRGTSYGHSRVQETDQIITTKGKVEGVCFNKTQHTFIEQNQKVEFTCDKEGKPSLVPIGTSDKNNEWYLFNSTEDEELINRFGPFTYNDEGTSSILGAADQISNLAQNLVSNIQNTFSSNKTDSSGSNNDSSTTANNTSGNSPTPTKTLTQPATQPTAIPASTTQPAPTRTPVAILGSNSDVQVYDPESNSTFIGQKGTQIFENYTLTTTDSRAEIDFTHGSKVRMDTNTKISIEGNYTDSFQAAIHIDVGRIWNRVKNLSGQDTYESESGNMVATVRGTAYSHEVVHGVDKHTDTIHTLEGKVWGKCKDDSEGKLVTGEKVVFNCNESDDEEIVQFLESIQDLPPQEAEWLIYNTAQDFQDEINTNEPPEITVVEPQDEDPQDPEIIKVSTSEYRLKLSTIVTDDAKPFKSLGTLWTMEEGPSDCTDSRGENIPCIYFTEKNNVVTEAVFKKAGTYHLQLIASDIYDSATQEFIVEVEDTNQAPQVNAGPTQLDLPDGEKTATLAGVVTDDGKPYDRIEVIKWEVVGGDSDDVVIDDPNKLNPTVTFAKEGMYTLKLQAFDGDKWGTDTINIEVTPGENIAPVVDAGEDQQLQLPDNVATLSAEITDDGMTEGPLEIEWTQTGGPTNCSSGCSDIESPNKADTNVTFKKKGTYTFKIEVDDGEEDDSDTVKVYVIEPSPTPTPTLEHTPTPTPTLTPSNTPTPTKVVPPPVVSSVTTFFNTCPADYYPLCLYTMIIIDGNNFNSVTKVTAFAGTSYTKDGEISSKTNTRMNVLFRDIKANSTFFLRLTYPGGTYSPVKKFSTKNPNDD